MNADSSKGTARNSSSCKKSKIMVRGRAGKLESGRGVVKEVRVESLSDKEEEGKGEMGIFQRNRKVVKKINVLRLRNKKLLGKILIR